MDAIAQARQDALAREPMRVAGSSSRFVRGTVHDLREILARRELLGMLVQRELKSRYKDSILGFFWTMARPLAMLLIYYVVLGQFLGAARSIPSFAIFVFTGLTLWTYFSEIVQVGTQSIVMNSGLVNKVALPREVFPLAVIGSATFNFVIQFAILIAATLVTRQAPAIAHVWYVVPSLAVVVIWGAALALLLSAVNVFLRDIQYLVEIVLMVAFWASPIVYSWKLVNDRLGGGLLGHLYLANPATQAVLGFQRALWVAGDGQPVPAHLAVWLGASIGVGAIALWLSQRVFARLQGSFAQEL